MSPDSAKGEGGDRKQRRRGGYTGREGERGHGKSERSYLITKDGEE